MALTMSDTGAVMSVYSSIIEYDCNWLLLHYVSESPDELGLHSYGRDGLEELKTKLSDKAVFVAFYREEVEVDPGYIIINYIPPSISGVRRARALVHSRRVGAIFKQHQTIFTVDNISLLTTENIHQAIVNPDHAFPSASPPIVPAQLPSQNPPPSPPHEDIDIYTFDSVKRSLPAQPLPPLPPLQPVRAPTVNQDSPPKAIVTNMARRSFTATYAPEVQPPSAIPPVPHLPKGGSLFTNLLRRKKKADDSYDDMNASLPPPTPPKDTTKFAVHPVTLSHSLPAGHPSNVQPLRHHRSRSMSEFAVISHVRGSDEVVIEPERYQTFTLRPSGKWSHDLPSDPEERARRRRELHLQREREEREALEEEAERQRQLKWQKEEFERMEREDEARRKADVEREIRRITAERRLREMLEKEEDERKRQELEERKRIDRERRLEEHRRLEEWRAAQARKEEALTRQAEDAKRQEDVERKRRIQQAAAKVKRTKEEAGLTGWITVQSADSLSWKRRFYKFVGSTIHLHRSPKDMSTFLEEVDLRGRVRGLREWNEGYDYLEAIPFSFVVEFKDNTDNWSMFADSEEEKYAILGLFKMAAGL